MYVIRKGQKDFLYFQWLNLPLISLKTLNQSNLCFSVIHEEDRSNENKFSETVLIFFFEPIVKYVDFQLWLIAELNLEFVPKRLSLSQID